MNAKNFRVLQDELFRFYPKSSDFESFHVNGRINATERSSILRDFIETSPSLVTNSKCLNEGIDYPDIDSMPDFKNMSFTNDEKIDLCNMDESDNEKIKKCIEKIKNINE